MYIRRRTSGGTINNQTVRGELSLMRVNSSARAQLTLETSTTPISLVKINLFCRQIYKKELSIIGVLINPFSFLKGLALLQAMSDKYIDFDKLGIKLFPLSQYKQALAALKNGEISKAIFKL